MNDPLSFTVGFLAGLATNLISWWILFHFVVPRIAFSTAISKLPTSPSEHDRCGFRYRLKFRNGGGRGIIDVELAVTLRIEGLTARKNIEVIAIPWNTDGEKRAHIVRLLPRKPGLKAAHILRLYINSVEQFRTRSIYPGSIREKACQRILTLEDLLGLGTNA